MEIASGFFARLQGGDLVRSRVLIIEIDSNKLMH